MKEYFGYALIMSGAFIFCLTMSSYAGEDMLEEFFIERDYPFWIPLCLIMGGGIYQVLRFMRSIQQPIKQNNKSGKT